MYRPSKPGGRAFLSMPTQRIGPTNEIKIRHDARENENDRNMHAYSRRHIYTHICIDQCNTSVFRAWPRFTRASSTSPAHGRAVCMATGRHVESARGTRRRNAWRRRLLLSICARPMQRRLCAIYAGAASCALPTLASGNEQVQYIPDMIAKLQMHAYFHALSS